MMGGGSHGGQGGQGGMQEGGYAEGGAMQGYGDAGAASYGAEQYGSAATGYSNCVTYHTQFLECMKAQMNNYQVCGNNFEMFSQCEG